MTTEEIDKEGESLEVLNANLAKIEELSQRLISSVSRKKRVNPGLHGPDPDLFQKAAQAYTNGLMTDPSRLFETQVEYWGKALTHYVEVQQQLIQGVLAPPEDKTPSDPRFANPMWSEHPYFNFVKQQYLISAQAISDAVE